MSLITEINRTNTSKEKAKKDKVNINNKLVSLGGQSATDLSKVPEKIQQMVTGNYKKLAYGEYSVSCYTRGSIYNSRIVSLKNVNFNIKRIILINEGFYETFSGKSKICYNGIIDTEKLPNGKDNITCLGVIGPNSSSKGYVFIEKAIWKDNKTLEIFPTNEVVGTEFGYWGKFIAIG